MSTQDPGTPEASSPPAEPTDGPPPGGATPDKTSGKSRANKPGPTSNPLRHSRTSGLWIGVAFSIVLLVLLVVFIIQNTQTVTISFFGFEGEAPLAAALLIAAAGGLAIATVVGTLRIMQLRRRVKRESS